MSEIVRGDDIHTVIAEEVAKCAVVVTDDNVAQLYPDLTVGAVVVRSGESCKTPETLLAVLDAMAKMNLGRKDRIAAIGGGTVGDVAGLAAALYMRGIDYISVPTTLLAMVDSGIGGKTAIDFCGVKNLVGAFHSPIKTLISYDFLKTLSQRELLCGCGEIIKTCLLTARSFELLCAGARELRSLDIQVVARFAKECADIKNKVVCSDPYERAVRKILNVGHTVGHALEAADGYKLSHGEYVLKGIMTECAMFREYIQSDYYQKIMGIVGDFASPPRTSARVVTKLAGADKKNIGNRITVMLPTAVGEVAELGVKAEEFSTRYAAAIKELRQ